MKQSDQSRQRNEVAEMISNAGFNERGMKMYQKSLRDYKETRILTADPGQIILMLYDAAISDLECAAEYAREKKYDKRAAKIEHANEIILELLASLDFDSGGEIAASLSRIYSFLSVEILRAVQKNDPEAILKCRDIVRPLRDAWAQILKANKHVHGDAPASRQVRYLATA